MRLASWAIGDKIGCDHSLVEERPVYRESGDRVNIGVSGELINMARTIMRISGSEYLCRSRRRSFGLETYFDWLEYIAYSASEACVELCRNRNTA